MNDVLAEKADSLQRCITRIESRKPFDVEQLRTDPDLQDIVTLNLQRAVQLAVDMASIVLSQHTTPVRPQMADMFRMLGSSGVIRPSWRSAWRNPSGSATWQSTTTRASTGALSTASLTSDRATSNNSSSNYRLHKI